MEAKIKALFYTRATKGLRILETIDIPLEWLKDTFECDYTKLNEYLNNVHKNIEDYEEITFNMGNDSEVVTFVSKDKSKG